MNPDVSVVMPARDVEAYVGEALTSVLSQTLERLEVIVVDDGSTDGTGEIVSEFARQDPRVRLISRSGIGPAAARNAALAASNGRWLAIIDADDTIEPDRLERLVSLAEREQAAIVSDNLWAWYEDGAPSHLWLDEPEWTSDRDIDLSVLLSMQGQSSRLGYLKPVISLDFIRRHALTYDERLWVGEDFDFVLRLLAAGARYRFSPTPGYRYRRRAGSASHRIREDRLRAIAAALTEVRPTIDPNLRGLIDQRVKVAHDEMDFDRLIGALKGYRLGAALSHLTRASMRARLITAAREGLQSRGRKLLNGRRRPLGDALADEHPREPAVEAR